MWFGHFSLINPDIKIVLWIISYVLSLYNIDIFSSAESMKCFSIGIIWLGFFGEGRDFVGIGH